MRITEIPKRINNPLFFMTREIMAMLTIIHDEFNIKEVMASFLKLWLRNRNVISLTCKAEQKMMHLFFRYIGIFFIYLLFPLINPRI